MSSIAASAGEVVFIPKPSGSYFYESFPCVQAQSQGYGGLRFSILGPAGGSVSLELQTSTNCNATGHTSSYTILTSLTGQRQIQTLPLLGFDNDPNYDAIVGLAWSEFSNTNTRWSIGNITLVCGAVGAPPVTSKLLLGTRMDLGRYILIFCSATAYTDSDDADKTNYDPNRNTHKQCLLQPAHR